MRRRLAAVVGLGASLLLSTGQADAQWRYIDDTGASKVTQYKINVPAPYRDAAVWIGPVGTGNPALSADRIREAQRWEAVRRIVAAETELLRYRNLPTPAPPRPEPGPAPRPMATMCIAGELRTMSSPGSWKVVGACVPGFSTGYGTDGYGSVGGFTVR